MELRVNTHMAAHLVENRREQNTDVEDAPNSAHERDQDADAKLNG